MHPVFPPSFNFSAFNLAVDAVHLQIIRPPDVILRDSIVPFDINLDRIQVTLPVVLRSTAESLTVNMELLGGGQVLFSGSRTIEVIAGPAGSTPPPILVLNYVGPGAQLTGVSLSPLDTTATLGDSVTMQIAGFDANQAPVPSFYVSWSVNDTTLATVNPLGIVRDRGLRGTVYVRAQTPSTSTAPAGVAESTTVTFTAAPGSVVAVSGDGQTAAAGATLPQPMVVRVLGTDGLGLAGATVQFAAPGGGSVAPTSAVSDAAGLAQTVATLGSTVGAQTFTASLGTVSTVTFNATATLPPGVADSIAIAAGDGQSAPAGGTVAVPPSVVVLDNTGSPVPGVAVTFAVASGGGSLTGGSTSTNASGIATVGSWTLGATPGTNTLTATAGGTGIKGNPVTFTATGTGPAGVTTWTGASSSDWSNAANWSNGVPASTDSAVIVAATVAPQLTGSVSVGAVAVMGGSLTLNGHAMAVARSFATMGTGIVVMNNPGDALAVSGDAVFQGGNELGSMSAGSLTIGGDLTQLAGNSGDSFHPSGSHVTLLTGNSPTVSFASPGIVPGTSHFQDLVWTGTGILTLGSDAYAHGTLSGAPGVSGRIQGTGGKFLSVGGLVSNGVIFDNVRLIIDQPAGLSIGLSNVTFSNQDPTLIQLQVNHPGAGSPFTFSNLTFNTTPTSGFYLFANDLVPSDGQVLTIDMANPTPSSGGIFISLGGGAMVNWPAGGGGGSRTWTGAVSTDWNTAGNWSPAGVPGTGADVLIPVSAANQPVLNNNVTLNNLTVENNALITLGATDTITITGDATSSDPEFGAGGVSGGTVILEGPANTVSGIFPALVVTGDYTVTGFSLSTSLEINGTGANLTLGGQSFTTGPLLTVNGGTVTMTDQFDFLSVSSGTFAGGNETGLLTDGVLVMNGSLTSATGPAFVGSGNHTVDFTSAGGSINLAPGSTISNLILVFSGTLTMQSRLAVTGVVSFASGTLVLGGHTLDVGGDFSISGVGAFLAMTNALDSLLVGGDALFDGDDSFAAQTFGNGVIRIGGSFVQGSSISPQSFAPTTAAGPGTRVVLTGAGSTIFSSAAASGGSYFLNLDVAGSQSLGSPVFVNGSLQILSGGALNLAGQRMDILGSLNTLGTGTLTMTSSADSVLVTGAAIFGGGDETGKLTGGFLSIGGSFNQTAANSGSSFAATSPHLTRIGAGGVRVATFATPGTGAGFSHFGDLDVGPALGGLTLNSDVFVDGTLIQQNRTPPTISGGGRLLTAMGLNVDGLKLDNTRIFWNEPSAAPVQFDNVTWTGISTSVTQLRISAFGAALAPRVIPFQNLMFTHISATPGLYVDLKSANGLGVTVQLPGSNESPSVNGNGPSFSNPVDQTTVGGATITWP